MDTNTAGIPPVKSIGLSNIEIQGELAFRALMNYARMEGRSYRPEAIFRADQNGWPGDWEGRTILALTLLAQATHRPPAYLDAIVYQLRKQLNSKGYLGRILPESTYDEQQLSGHSWLLRGLCEYYLWKNDREVLNMIEGIVENLLLPVEGYYTTYPSQPQQRVYEGEAAGRLTGNLVGNWYISTDTGCAYIMLDGATQAYRILKLPRLKKLVEEMIEGFLSLDLLSLSVQTHATLSALRGILRFYEITGDRQYLSAAENVFRMYLKQGMTENHANYNWFGRPEWTEPCAVIDSFLLSADLWKLTGKIEYLEEAHSIYYNAIGYGQRPNGGFGCDTCAGSADQFISPREGLFEAFWCCSMRGGEGLSRAAEYCCFTAEDSICIPFYHPGIFSVSSGSGSLVLREWTQYPYDGEVCLEIVSADTKDSRTFKFFIPSWTEPSTVRITVNEAPAKFSQDRGFAVLEVQPEKGMKIGLLFDIPLRRQNTLNVHSIKDCYSLYHGFMMMGVDNRGGSIRPESGSRFEKTGPAAYRIEGTEWVLSPINDMIDLDMQQACENKRQVLFKY